MVTGFLGITAIATGVPVWGLAAIAADQLLDAPKLKEISQSIRNLVAENNKVNKSSVGMLFSVSKKTEANVKTKRPLLADFCQFIPFLFSIF